MRNDEWAAFLHTGRLQTWLTRFNLLLQIRSPTIRAETMPAFHLIERISFSVANQTVLFWLENQTLVRIQP